MSASSNILSNLSIHLFWDIDKATFNPAKNRKQIIQRVLEYGLLNDWKIISAYYGILEISKIAVSIKDLDKKSMSFISALSGIPIEKFLCYPTRQSMPPYWNF